VAESPRHSDESESVYRLAARADVLDDPAVRRVVTAAAVSDDPWLQRQAKQVVVAKAVAQEANPFLGGDRTTIRGDTQLKFGVTTTGERVGLSEDALTKHMLIVGQSGAGKTTLFYNVMRQLSVPFWAFDLKRDYRHLITEVDDLVVLPWQQLTFNPLVPPQGVDLRRWAQVFSEIFSHATALLSGSKNYLMKQVIELYRLYGLFDQREPPYPSLFELKQLMERDKINYMRKPSKYRDTVVNRVEAMTLTAGSIFDCSLGIPIEALVDLNVVFEFDGLARDTQNFVMEILFAYVFEYRLAQQHRDTGLHHVFFLDEGKRVFSVYKERQDAAGIPAIDELTAKMREFGEGLVVADQEASKLTDSIKANTDTKLLLATGDRQQFQEMTAAMQLSERQQAVAETLDVGQAVMQTGGNDPLPVVLDDVEVAKTVSDVDLWIRQKAWFQAPVADREQPAAFVEEVGGHVESGDDEDSDDEETGQTSNSGKTEISGKAEMLLEDVVEHPFKFLTERYEAFDNDYQANQAKNELVDAGLVRERSLGIGGHPHKLLELTEQGKAWLADHDIEVTRTGRGSVVHRYWQHQVQEAFNLAGWTAELERHDTDVYVEMDGKEIAVEIAMGDNEREIEHAKQRLTEGFHKVIVVCPNQQVISKLKTKMKENDLDMKWLEFRPLRDFKDTEIFESDELGI